MSELVRTEFKISYDDKGELKNHTMDAKALGEAIVGMDDLITKAANLISNGSSEADLKVVAPAQEGSLEIVYAMIADPITTVAVLKAIGITAASAAAVAGSALGIVDRIKDKKVENVVINARTKEATFIAGDEEIKTSSDVAKLVSSKEIRQALSKVIQGPVAGRESPKVSFISEENNIILDEDEIKSFNPIRMDLTETQAVTNFEKVVQFTKLNFQGSRGWSIASRDGFETGVTIRDKNFLRKVSANEEAFQKEKFYTVEIEKKETNDLGGTRIRYAIIRVINEIQE